MAVTVRVLVPDTSVGAPPGAAKVTTKTYREGVDVERTADGGLDVYGAGAPGARQLLGGHAVGWQSYVIRQPAPTGS